MTRNAKQNSIKFKSILVLAISFMLCFVLFFCTACGTTDNDDTTTSYDKVENDTALISNGSFEFGTYKLKIEDFPKTSSISGWSSVATDNSASTSKVPSGVVKTSTDAWDKLIDKLYDDADFLKYAKNIWSITATEEASIKAEIKQNFPAPVRSGVDSDNVLMINNVSDEAPDIGTAQKLTSSSTVTLEKGTYGVFSVWVKTANIVNTSDTGRGGANIRLVNTIDSNSQADYAIYGIATTDWTEYKIYVKADESYDSTFKVVLGLGFGNGKNYAKDFVQGTAFFDDVTFTEIDESAYTDATQSLNVSSMDFGSVEKIYESANTISTFAYETVLDESEYFDDLESFANETSFPSYGTPDSTSDATVEDKTANSFKIVSNKASSITKITSGRFSVAPESYALVTFDIENKLDRFDKNGVTVYAGPDKDGKEVKITTFTEVGKKDTCSVLFKNNFPDGSNKTFYLVFVVGPTAQDSVIANYATGEILVSNIKIAKGHSYQYVKDSYGANTDVETDNYDYYSFFSSKAAATHVLYEGYSSDYVEDSNSTSYSFTPSSSSTGDILIGASNVANYTGVTSDSTFLNSANTNFNSNTRSGSGNADGVAGLINTKYFSGYNSTLASAISPELAGLYNADKNIQPLMIYNKASSAYGFIGKTLTVSASSQAKISVDVRVTGSAKAYIYLVDTFGDVKNVFKLDDFKSNTDGYNYVDNGTEYKNNEMFFTVDANGMNGEDWKTVTFYVATGATEKKFRLEMWNGDRNGDNNSTGFVFFDNVSVSTSGGFTEYTETEGNSFPSTFVDSSSVLAGVNASVKVLHRRELDSVEIEYNKTHSDTAVSYDAKYIWVKADDVVYAVFNTIDPVEVDPYASETEEETESGCTATSDPSTFWLSFSSILLGAALVLAIVMLIVKNAVRRHKANASDAKSHYKVTSRYSAKKGQKTEKVETVEAEPDEVEEPITEDEVVEEEKKEETLDDYVYGDVQDFGDDNKEN
ncbi:MAG: hypothetical protein E7369_04135 [Clostridiales bacterium]|nr:hypothetical protein [Clostridiales bacterium]